MRAGVFRDGVSQSARRLLRGRAWRVWAASCILALLAWLGAAATASAEDAGFRAPFVLQPGIGLSEQYGYAPRYTRNVPAFDAANHVYIRSRTSHGAYTSYVHTLRSGSWLQLDFLSALRAAYPAFTGTVGASGLRSDRIVFDRQDRAYSPLTIRLRDGSTRNVLMVSWDHCRTWKVFELPPGEVAVERWVGHNEIDGPPFLAIWRKWKPSRAANAQRNSLWVTKPSLNGETLVIPAAALVTRECIGLHKDSGGASFAVTHGSTTTFTWAEATTRDKPATPQYVATYDHESGVVSRPIFMARTQPANDGHNKPGLCIDSAGYLHWVAGTHGSAVLYRRSLMPHTPAAGWTSAEAVLSDGYVVDDTLPSLQEGRQTYNALVCDSNDTLHLVTRQWRKGVDGYHAGREYGALIHQSRPPDGQWSSPTVVVIAAEPGYSVFFHKLALDHGDRLFLSCSYNGGTERERHSARMTELERLGRSEEQMGKYARRMLLVSDDGGATWRFAQDADLAAPGEPVPAKQPPRRSGRKPGAVPYGVQWAWLRPRPQGNQLTALDFVNSRIGWAVGTHGTIMRSTDGGVTWRPQWSGTTMDIYAVAAVSARTAWVVGKDGLILKTTDAGFTWRAQDSLTTRSLFAVSVQSANVAQVVGHRGVVRITSDGGRTWRIGYSKTSRPLFSVSFVDSRRGWACGGRGRLIATTDGGRTWHAQHSGATESLHAVSFLNRSLGLAVGSGVAVFTRDGGRTWQRSLFTAPAARAARLVSRGLAYATGADGAFFVSGDGGRNWSQRQLPLGGMCGALDANRKGSVWTGGVGGTVVWSRDRGRSWSRLEFGATSLLRGTERTANGTWVVGAKGLVSESQDGGTTWRQRATPVSEGLNAISFGANDGWAVGENGTILRSRDGGASWSRVWSPTSKRLAAVAATGPGDAWVVGDGGVLMKTTDGGEGWSALGVPAEDLSCIQFQGDVGWAGGGGARGDVPALLLRTTDRGRTWNEIRLPVWGRVQDVCFLNQTEGWAAVVDWGLDCDSRGGAVLFTRDGGATWAAQARTATALTSLCMSDRLNGWAFGEEGTALWTWDGGSSWLPYDIGTDTALYDAGLDADGNPLTIGQGGAVLLGLRLLPNPD